MKYSGKTNEAFTALLYNVTLWASAFSGEFNSRMRVLDPVCGRGTTLYYGLYMGHDVDGIEVAKGDVQAIDEFFTRYLKDHKYKHSIDRGRFKRPQGGVGKKFFVQGAPDKETQKSNPFSAMVVNDDTVNANNHYSKNTYHAIVADLPYGVQHGGTGHGRGYIKTDDLLKRALPGWMKVLKSGGSMGMSWNVNSMPRNELSAILDKAGMEVLDQAPYSSFVHRVDQAVRRDLIVAIKP
jgi:tRNA G10  N-methylase Trm11